MEWQEKDLSTWAKESLPEYLSSALKDLHGPVQTPWSSYEVHLSRVEVSGEAGLCGRKGKAVLQFDLDIGAQLDIIKATRFYDIETVEGSWQAVLRIFRFEPGVSPEIQVQFDDPRTEVASEVAWFFQKGLGSRLLLNALNRWHAAADKTQPGGAKQFWYDPLRPFRQRLSSAPRKAATKVCARKPDKETHLRPKVPVATAGPRARRYPWPSSLAGVYGPANQQVDGFNGFNGFSSGGSEPSEPSDWNRGKKLHEAILNGDFLQVFKLLGDDIVDSPVGDEGLRPIHSAILNGSPDMLELLLKAQADVGQKDALGRIPLTMALKRGSLPQTKQLLEAGAFELAEKDLQGESLKDILSQSLDFRTAPELLDLIDSKERPRRQGRALIKAILRDARTAEAALDAGASPSFADERGDLPLHLLARAKYQEESAVRLLQKLVKARADVNCGNPRGETPLLFASHRGGLAFVEALLKIRADPSLANYEGSTALMYAAHGGHEDVCTVLLEAFAPAAVTNQHGLTAEEMATKRGFRRLGAIIAAHAMAPKRPGEAEDKMTQAVVKESNFDMEEVVRAMRPPFAEDQTIAKSKVKSFDDYQKWERIVEELEQQEEVEDRRQSLEKHPEFIWKNGVKMRVML
ncbi:unnamed protein product [Cladocopium goreaui]|uniref:40S ribosomal protein S12 n=1 Tax=Cladocopium goreaui TaxID=2562237 RepID=A0A9P1DMV9_9DINO|nr:unnamed protein product [Cladocopium goreaui]